MICSNGDINGILYDVDVKSDREGVLQYEIRINPPYDVYHHGGLCMHCLDGVFGHVV